MRRDIKIRNAQYPIHRVIFMHSVLYVLGEKLYNLCNLYAARVPQGVVEQLRRACCGADCSGLGFAIWRSTLNWL
jgi:hypothetical protein